MNKFDALLRARMPVGWRLFPVLAAALALPCFPSRAASGGTGISVVHTFSPILGAYPDVSNSDGASPGASMTLGNDGNLYGTTLTGGSHGAGVIFELFTNGTLTNWFNFHGIIASDGSVYSPGLNALTPGPKGFFYGTTQSGGPNQNGSIFKWSPAAGEADLYAFSAESTNVDGSNPDGMNPSGALVETNGVFYGTTQYGGTNGNGTIFQFTPYGAGFASLYSFSAFETNSSANSDGATPNPLIIGTDGNFYGTTQLGGAYGAGEFFQLTVSGALNPLYSFGETTNDAAYPQDTLLQGPDGNFYGVSQFGGSSGNGTIFEISPAGVENVLYSFTGGSDGSDPTTALILGTDGNFYGTTGGGGANGTGALFEISPAGVFAPLFSFPALNANSENSIGEYPVAALAMGKDGNLYGICEFGGAYGNGTIFRYTNAVFYAPNQPPVFTVQPPPKSGGLAGVYVTLSAAAKGEPPLSFQWLKNKTNLLSDGGDFLGSMTSSLTIGPLQLSDAGSYSVVVSNNFGATTSSVAVLAVTPETTSPNAAIISPAAGARTNSPVFSGTASDVVRVTNVVWWLTNGNGAPLLSGTALLAQGGSNWSFAATPYPGTNILAVQSENWSCLTSKIAKQTFFYKVPYPLTLQTNGDGTGSFKNAAASVKNDAPPANGAMLNIGEGYSIQAVVGGNSLFSNWVSSSALGVFTNTNSALAFVMQSNMVLTANFATNFFIAAHGTYNGLFFNTNAVAANSSGMIQGLLLATNGTFSGKLLKAGTPYTLSGAFDVSGHFSNSVGTASAPGGLLRVNLEVDGAAGRIVGTVSNTQWSASLAAEMAGSNLPSAEYTMLLTPLPGAPANTPPGDGYAAATNQRGTLTVTTGQLADGASFTPSAAESANGDVPVYASLYGNTGLLIGWINLTNLEAGPPSNLLAWIKPASRAYPPYTNGFAAMLALQGALWTNPPLKTPAIALTNGSLLISNATLSLAFNVAVSGSNTLVKLAGSPSNYMLTGSIAPRTGLLALSFGGTNGKNLTQGFGAVIQNQTNGGGFFLGTTNAGSISLLPPD